MNYYDDCGSFEDYITYDDISDDFEPPVNTWSEDIYRHIPDAHRWRSLDWIEAVFGKYDELYVECHAEYPRCWLFIGNGDDSIEYISGYVSATIAEYLKRKFRRDPSMHDALVLIKCMQKLGIAKED